MTNILPRFIRYRDVAAYLGMDRNRFDAEVRPGLVEIPIGDRGIAFDRIDLDTWADEYKARNGKLGRNYVEPKSANQTGEAVKPASQKSFEKKNYSLSYADNQALEKI